MEVTQSKKCQVGKIKGTHNNKTWVTHHHSNQAVTLPNNNQWDTLHSNKWVVTPHNRDTLQNTVDIHPNMVAIPLSRDMVIWDIRHSKKWDMENHNLHRLDNLLIMLVEKIRPVNTNFNLVMKLTVVSSVKLLTMYQ